MVSAHVHLAVLSAAVLAQSISWRLLDGREHNEVPQTKEREHDTDS